MDKEYTHITLVIDHSSSMHHQWDAVKSGYEEIIKSNQEAEGFATLSLYGFNHSVSNPINFMSIDDASSEIDLLPSGCTALFDAVGTAIDETGQNLALLEECDRPSNVIVMIYTDGFENSSIEYTALRVERMVKKQEDEYNWKFIFIGAGKEFFDQADSMGLGKSFISHSEDKLEKAYSSLGEKTKMFRSAVLHGDINAADILKYTEEEKSELD